MINADAVARELLSKADMSVPIETYVFKFSSDILPNGVKEGKIYGVRVLVDESLPTGTILLERE